jgi:AcrR family transcriptional regulator
VDNRSLILEKALELFAARGYNGVGVQEIAEAAGITKPTLYHYFGSKQGLFSALLSAHQQPLLESIRGAAAYYGDLPQSLESLTRAYFLFATENPVFYRLQLALYFGPRSSEAWQMVVSGNEAQQQVVESLFLSAVQRYGNIRGRHRLIATTLIGTINTCIGLWLNGFVELDETLLTQILRQFQYGIYS